ncbi:outer membrane beta-barrel protein [Ekhidna sp.]|uniref:outer membrane beta-barrel protein n=1 Tax=Ekhidna sp. TaxID=2608089 RepID=UPI003CCB82CA
MGPESFENSIQKKFENQTIKAPERVWENIENALNAEFVAVYASQHSIYKWVSVAAVFIAVLLLGVLVFPINSEVKQQSSNSYNALLENDWDYSNYYYSSEAYEPVSFNFTPVSISPEQEEKTGQFENILTTEKSRILVLDSRKLDLPQADVEAEIYPYYFAGVAYTKSKKASTKDNQKMWAGVEAGAGTFNADFAGSGVLSNSLKPAGLASAVGSGNFVNPTTNIQQEMEEGIATSIGIDFGVALGKRWTLESGLAYTSMDNRGSASINVLDVYTIDNQDLINENGGIDDGVQPGFSSREATIEIEENYDHQIDLNNNVQFASIPLKAGYFVLNKKISLRVNAGLSANYLVEGNLSDPTREILNSDELNLYNEWSFDGVGGFEFGYSLFDKFDLTVEPNYRHSITPISNSVNSPSRIIVQTGFRYTLK